MPILDDVKRSFAALTAAHDLSEQPVQVRVKPLSVQQAIGTPDRDDFPIQKGKERIVEATFSTSAGHAFTDAFCDYSDTIAGLLDLDLRDPFNRSVFTASVNAVMRHMGRTRGTVHCRDKEPTQCAPMLVEYLQQNHPGARKIALVGLQPAMADALVDAYDLAIVDLDPDNIGRRIAGVSVRDGKSELSAAIGGSDVVVATGSTASNGSIDVITKTAGDRPVVFFGVTISGAADLLGLERFCPFGH
jgi:uncharacterized protein (DUF4213/DUF364 family)